MDGSGSNDTLARRSDPTLEGTLHAEEAKGHAPRRREGARQRLAAFLKRWSWRLTASLAWLHVFSFLFAGRDVFSIPERWLAQGVVSILATMGFAPTNPTYFRSAAKAGWVLLITGFSLTGVLGLFLYIVFFLFVFPFLLLAGRRLREAGTGASNYPSRRTSGPKARVATRAVWCALFAWVFLYGNAAQGRQILPGLILTGALALIFTFRAFERARPLIDTEPTLFDSLLEFETKILDAVRNQDKTTTPKTRAEASIRLKIWWFARAISRTVALILRGSRGAKRTSLLILAEYVVSFLLVGSSAVTFWALAVRFSSAPRPVSFSLCLWASAYHFLPGLATPPIPVPPLWVQGGASITAWVLLVLYAGPASSVVSARQHAYVRRLRALYPRYRVVSLGIRACFRSWEKKRDALTT